MKRQYAIITGAGSRLGKAYALELARREINLILISPPQERPENTFLGLEGIDVRYYETDLTSHRNLMEVTEWINSNFEVAMLINNAGLTDSKRLGDAGNDKLNANIQLNTMSISLLTRALLPNLMRQRKSYVLNVSDMMAFNPRGFKTVYPATNAFVRYFTRTLFHEMRDTNVFVSVVSPGPMRIKRDMRDHTPRYRIFEKFALPTPERVAHISIRQLFRRNPVIMVGIGSVINWLLLKIIPVWIPLFLFTSFFKREMSNGSSQRQLLR